MSRSKDSATSARTPRDFLDLAEFPIVAISDITGAYFRPDGIDISARCITSTPAKMGWRVSTGADKIANDELLELDVESTDPRGAGGCDPRRERRKIRAKTIVEAANGPVMPEADKVLNDRGITVIPDILANAGGVTASYFEWVQNYQQYTWKMDRVANRTRFRAEPAPSRRFGTLSASAM